MGYLVHLAFGFHVNCYHSYRGDTPDKAGFGGDLRIIRNTIKVLDDFNKQGINVKGTWDSENVYSLEKILPTYAKDIIESWQRRVKENGDEQILMGYNNGALTGLTADEFKASINLAVTNKEGSGLKDLFSDYKMVIRPQEVMFSPSDVKYYEELGVEAVCLYYSTNPFDAFGSLIKPLKDEQAFNPLTYAYQGHKVKIIPTYSQLDLMDHGSLSYLLYKLHDEQEKGLINRDVFLFINMDADSFFWEKLPLPKTFQKKPNFGGLEGLIKEAEKLSWVVFDTPGNYLKTHDSAGDVFFGEDTADGNFTGYASWGEKPFNRQIWSRAEKARSFARLYDSDASSPSFMDRVKLLSTTHFGLASPVLNIVREEKALLLSSKAIEEEVQALKPNQKLTIFKSAGGLTSLFTLKAAEGELKDISLFTLKSSDLKSFCALPFSFYPDHSVKEILVSVLFKEDKKEYEFTIVQEERKETVPFASGNSVHYDTNRKSLILELEGYKDKIDLTSFITYQKKQHFFAEPVLKEVKTAGEGQAFSFNGEIHLPKEKKSGSYSFLFFEVPYFKGLLMINEVNYPFSEEREQISSSASDLGRFTDNKWEEAVPYSLNIKIADEAVINKRNFRGELSSFPLKDLYSASEKNRNLASFNQAVSGGFISISSAGQKLSLGHLRTYSGSLAHCPMRLKDEKEGRFLLSLNPFGTYFGKQRSFESEGNGAVVDIYSSFAPQAYSLAPSYNGVRERSIQFLSANEDEKTLASLADGSVVLPSSSSYGPDLTDPVEFMTKEEKGVQKEGKKTSPLHGKVFIFLHALNKLIANSRHFRRKLKKLQKSFNVPR